MSESVGTKRTRDLADTLRKDPTRFGRAVVTRVNALGPEFVLRAMQAVACFKGFTEDNDPWGEHDFGTFHLGGDKLFWKIDAYEKGSAYSAGAESPENPATTDRVLTVMLAEEY